MICSIQYSGFEVVYVSKIDAQMKMESPGHLVIGVMVSRAKFRFRLPSLTELSDQA